MGTVNVRELRNHGGEVLDRVAAGEVIIVERSGKPVAQLTRLPQKGLSTPELIEEVRRLPPVDYEAMRRELDEIIDPSL